jgi:predicted enzyme related to lactoylglutathione lyase
MTSAITFYEHLFGWKCEVEGPAEFSYGQFKLGGEYVAGVGQMSEEMKRQGIPPLWNSYIEVASVEEITQRASELGGTVTVPPMQVLEEGKLAFFQDPTGGHVGLWQPLRHKGATLKGPPGAFCWNELATRDIEKARDFYGKLLGWEFADHPHTPSKYYLIKNQGHGNGGMIQMTAEWGDMPPYWGVYFNVTDLHVAATRLQQLGGKILVPPFDTTAGPISVVADPQGACFSLIQVKTG